ncbi:Root phototropism protein 2 [Sesamum angolense]|uniref:Root phototropism protein 2 n=1 Tax=Sesamum angolense TaxID=2727404 RepID=A0AAE2C3S3_9LAMI|nr:Root phototropism protein 2 [Sesamum angolense]
MIMPKPIKHNSNISLAMERAGQWVFSQEIPTDVVVEVGEVSFPLHKVMLVGKSNHIRELILESKEVDCSRIDLSGVPGGAETFEE